MDHKQAPEQLQQMTENEMVQRNGGDRRSKNCREKLAIANKRKEHGSLFMNLRQTFTEMPN